MLVWGVFFFNLFVFKKTNFFGLMLVEFEIKSAMAKDNRFENLTHGSES